MDDVMRVFDRAVINHLRNYIKMEDQTTLDDLVTMLDNIKINFRIYSAVERDLEALWAMMRDHDSQVDMVCETISDFLFRAASIVDMESVRQQLATAITTPRAGFSPNVKSQRPQPIADTDFIERGLTNAHWVMLLSAESWLLFPVLWKLSHLTSDEALIAAGLRLGPRGKIRETKTAG